MKTLILAFAATLVVGSDLILDTVNVTDFANVSGCSDIAVNTEKNQIYFLDGNSLKEMDMQTLVANTFATADTFSLTSGDKIFFGSQANSAVQTVNVTTYTASSPTPFPSGGTLVRVAGSEVSGIYYAMYNYSGTLQMTSYDTELTKLFDNTNTYDNPSGLSVAGDGKSYLCVDGQLGTKYFSSSSSVFSGTIIGAKSLPDDVDGGIATGRVPASCFLSTENVSKATPEWIYIVSDENNLVRLTNIAKQEIFTIAGLKGVSGDATGNGTEARFSTPKGISVVEVSPTEHHAYVCDSANNKIKKIEVTFKPPCDSRIALVLDRTYASDTDITVTQIEHFTDAFVENLVFGGATMSVVNLKAHTTETFVAMTDQEATDKSKMKTALNGLYGGFRNRASQFWTLFTDIADSVAQAGKKSFIVLVSDGRLRDSWRWRQHFKKKEAMVAKWGSDSPTIACVLVRRTSINGFTGNICDSITYDGDGGQTLAEIGADMAVQVCQ